MKLIVFSAVMAMALAVLFSAGCGDDKEGAPAETQETQDVQEGGSDEATDGTAEESVDDASGEPAGDASEEPADDASEEPVEDSSDTAEEEDAGEISMKFSPQEEMLAYTIKTEMIVMEPMIFRAGIQRVN